MAHNNITFLDSYVLNKMEKNPRRSLSAMFRDLRMKVPLIGEYIIMKHVIRICNDNGYKFNEGQIRLTCQSSKEFKESMKKEKMAWLKDMLSVYEK